MLRWPHEDAARAVEVIRTYLADNEIEHQESVRDGVEGASFSLTLPGEKKLQTPVRLDVGAHALGVHAFVCRNPDENHARVYRWLLERNLRMYAVVVRRRPRRRHLPRGPAAAGPVSDEELDRVLGSVLANADESFNAILELGFASSIRKEWEWRISRGRVHAQPRGVPRLARGRATLAAVEEGLAPVEPVAASACAASSARPTIASAPPTKVSDGGTSLIVSHATRVAMPGTRNVVSESAPASVWVSA